MYFSPGFSNAVFISTAPMRRKRIKIPRYENYRIEEVPLSEVEEFEKRKNTLTTLNTRTPPDLIDLSILHNLKEEPLKVEIPAPFSSPLPIYPFINAVENDPMCTPIRFNR
jgi:hypothetical protein